MSDKDKKFLKVMAVYVLVVIGMSIYFKVWQ
jgi:hypothetical protein